MNELKQTYKKVEITYNERINKWQFEFDGAQRDAASLALAKKRIDQPRKFKPQACWAFCYGDNPVSGRLSSLVEDGRCCWFVDDDGARSKLGAGCVFLKTPANDELAGQIKAKVAQLKQIEREVDELRDKFTRPVSELWKDEMKESA